MCDCISFNMLCQVSIQEIDHESLKCVYIPNLYCSVTLRKPIFRCVILCGKLKTDAFRSIQWDHRTKVVNINKGNRPKLALTTRGANLKERTQLTI